MSGFKRENECKTYIAIFAKTLLYPLQAIVSGGVHRSLPQSAELGLSTIWTTTSYNCVR